MTEGYVWAVTAAGRVAFSGADAPAVRAKTQSELTAAKRPINLKNADDQSVAGMLAVQDACRRHNLSSQDLTEWGVLASPRTPGRSALVSALERYKTEGAWGISPHVIPHYSLHSLAGLLSVAFNFQGPNLGVGGICGGEGEAWLVGSAWLAEGLVPGLWLVMTGWDGPSCKGVAIALERETGVTHHSIAFCPPRRGANTFAPAFSLESLDRLLALGHEVPMRSRWSLPGGAMLEWRTRCAAESRAAA
jgi:hypothetical protein